MEKSKEFEKDPSEGELWEPSDLNETAGFQIGDRVRLTDTEKKHEGIVVGFSIRFGRKQIRIKLDEAPNKVATFELGLNMERV